MELGDLSSFNDSDWLSNFSSPFCKVDGGTKGVKFINP